MTIESEGQYEGLAAAGRAAADVLATLLEAAQPGVPTRELDRLGELRMRSHGARSAPRLGAGFPAATCISVNSEVAHGVPNHRRLRSGDLVNIDVSVELDGFWADNGASKVIGRSNPELDRLCQAGQQTLRAALGAVRSGRPLRSIGRAAQRCAASQGYEVLRDLHGHGVGRSLHEEPANISSHFDRRDRRRQKDGWVLAIEPFVSTGARHVVQRPDGWTLATEDGGLAVQYEHTVVVTRRGALVVTAAEPFLLAEA
ncbi:MAG: type I methionyl aminopeptidase [Acidobacteriota bacterium]